VDYTVNSIIGVSLCRAIPIPFRWLAEKLLPICRQIRADRRKAAKILYPISVQRTSEIEAAKQEGRQPNLPDDAFKWFQHAAAEREYDEVDIHLRLLAVAIHTSSDLLQQAILNLCANPGLVQPLRDEIKTVLGGFGWNKAMLTELRLMDSFLKETQRMKPIGTSTSCKHYFISTNDARFATLANTGSSFHASRRHHRCPSCEQCSCQKG
jgi:cytochrome P450